MPNMFHKWTRKGGGKRRRQSGAGDHKTWALTDAGVRLLATKDYEALSMARIAREAGMSVGALYARFPEKHTYLYRVVGEGSCFPQAAGTASETKTEAARGLTITHPRRERSG